MGFSIAEVVCDGARRRPDAVALRQAGRAMSYRALEALCRAIAGNLVGTFDVAVGDRVGLMMPNAIEWVAAYYGIQMAGAIPVPLNNLLAAPEAARIMNDAEPRVAIASARYGSIGRLEHAAAMASRNIPVVEFGQLTAPQGSFEPRIDRLPTDTAVILYTSGTTGQPKGVELSHFNVFWNAQLFARDLLRLTPDDRCLAVMPLSHVSGHTVAMTAGLFAGASVTLMERFDARSVMETISQDRITCFLGVPAMFWSLLDAPLPEGCDVSSLRACTSGGQALPKEVHRDFERRFNVEIAEGYGLTEFSPNITTNLFGAKKIGTVGPAVWGVEIRIIDEAGNRLPAGERGQVIARGPGMMKGYFRNPESTAQTLREGWLYTGDIGSLDGDGYLTIVDRMKEVIGSGGYNIYPREVEDALYAHADILEATVVGRPDARMGELPVAYIALKPGRSLDREGARAWCAERLSRYKVPRDFIILDILPKGATGKIDRLALKRKAIAGETP